MASSNGLSPPISIVSSDFCGKCNLRLTKTTRLVMGGSIWRYRHHHETLTCGQSVLYMLFFSKNIFFVRALCTIIERNIITQYAISPAKVHATRVLRWWLCPRNINATMALTLQRCLCITSVTLMRHPLMYVSTAQSVWLTPVLYRHHHYHK